MLILHTSDWHLGRTLEGRSRIEEQREFIAELCSIVEGQGVHLILLAGDVFDTYNPSAEAEELFYDALERLTANGTRAVVIIAGNHDSPDRLHAANPLAHRYGIFLGGYPGENLVRQQENLSATDDRVQILGGGAGWLELKIPGCSEQAVVSFLPYPSEQRLNEILSDSLDENKLQKAYSERVGLVLGQGAQHFRRDTVNLAVSHLFVLGGRSSESEREIQLGGAYLVEPAAMPDAAHYVALGHLHRPQQVGGTPVPCRYSGSPLCYSFSEADQQKEVVLINALPGLAAVVTSVKLAAGKPMRLFRFPSYAEALAWCEDPANIKCWADMEIFSPEPLGPAQVAELRKLHSGVINIRVMLPGITDDNSGSERLSEMSLEEKFNRFAARETGSQPEPDLVRIFMELLLEGDDDETH